jgi:hypothetical protein
VTLSALSPKAVLPRGGFRTLILILTIAATLNITLVSTSPKHLHLKQSPSQNRCELCFTAHTTTFEAPAVLPMRGPAIAGRFVWILPVFGYQACESQPHCSRGPPSSSL